VDCLLLVSSECDSAALAPLQQDFRGVDEVGLSTGSSPTPLNQVRKAYMNARRASGRARAARTLSGLRLHRGLTGFNALKECRTDTACGFTIPARRCWLRKLDRRISLA
jgi:hypothetical protein